MTRLHFLLLTLPLFLISPSCAQPFKLPTNNREILAPDGGAERFYVGVAGKLWTSGQFGCVRSDGYQLHEGLDIRPIDRDKRGEPKDNALCVANGTVAYVNTRSQLSNYGNYIVVRHQINRIEVFTLYAHLASISPQLKSGSNVSQGDPLGVVGRTSNTRQRITLERAHLHFEINFMANAKYSQWHASRMVGTRNDHGTFNGRNLLGIDPSAVLRNQTPASPSFDLARHLGTLPELCRVLVRKSSVDWVKRNPGAVRSNPNASHDPIAGWELALGFNGVPLHATPRTRSELTKVSNNLLSVNSEVAQAHPCGKLVVRHGQFWSLTPKGTHQLDLLGF